MNNHAMPAVISDFTHDLRAYLTLCEEVLALNTRENQSLSGQSEYQPFEFYQTRKAGILSRRSQRKLC